MMCKVLHINRSTVYKIFKYKMSDREIRRLELESKIIEIYNEFDSIYGAPKIRRELIKQGFYASLKRVSVYMRRLELRSIITKKYKPGSSSKAPDETKKDSNTKTALDYCNRLYNLDKASKEVPFKQKHEFKQTYIKPVMDEFKTWLDERSLTCAPESVYGKAILYATHIYPKLMNYLNDSRLSIDNNKAERAVKPFVSGYLVIHQMAQIQVLCYIQSRRVV